MMLTSPSSSLELAAIEAALADGVLPTQDKNHPLYDHRTSSFQSDKTKSKRTSDDVENAVFRTGKKASLRRGKWTSEEEAYANRLIHEFKLGLLPLTDGTTLRTFLSKLLHCDPMRISKKYVGHNCIGKQVFRRRQQDLEKLTEEQMESNRKELAELERNFLERVAQTNRTKSSAPKNGKFYGGEDHGSALAPWLMPPDDGEQAGYPQKQQGGNKWAADSSSSLSTEMVYRTSADSNASIERFTPIDSLTSMNRINSLEALCSIDTAAAAKPSPFPPQSFDFMQSFYGQSEHCFPWSSSMSVPLIAKAELGEQTKQANNAVDNLDITAIAQSTVCNPTSTSPQSAVGGLGATSSQPSHGPAAARAPSADMPRNSSVENFWMLVNMGDIPCPDKGVLSETLWGRDGGANS